MQGKSAFTASALSEARKRVKPLAMNAFVASARAKRILRFVKVGQGSEYWRARSNDAVFLDPRRRWRFSVQIHHVKQRADFSAIGASCLAQRRMNQVYYCAACLN